MTAILALPFLSNIPRLHNGPSGLGMACPSSDYVFFFLLDFFSFLYVFFLFL
jgi:hypothetical protein